MIVLEEPIEAQRTQDGILRDGGVTIVRPRRQRIDRDEPVDARAIDTVRRVLGSRQPMVWLYTPLMLPLAGALLPAPIVYDCMDDLAAFAHASPRLAQLEPQLLEAAALVFAGGWSLYERRKPWGGKVRLYPSGVDFEFFARARTVAPHPALRELARPRFGYAGVIDERIDVQLVEALAARTAGTVVMIGPTAKIDEAGLPRRSNIAYLGLRPFDELPSLFAGLDVALMPFAANESTRFISPTKTLEYLAAGLPVISTSVRDVVSSYSDVVTIADGPAFSAAAAIAAGNVHDPVPGMDRARQASWDDIAASMWSDLCGVADGN